MQEANQVFLADKLIESRAFINFVRIKQTVNTSILCIDVTNWCHMIGNDIVQSFNICVATTINRKISLDCLTSEQQYINV